jgi:hypothetical protein
VQPKLALGPVDDPLEHEADRIADQVMHMPHPGASGGGNLLSGSARPTVQRACAVCNDEGKKFWAKERVPMLAPALEARDIELVGTGHRFGGLQSPVLTACGLALDGLGNRAMLALLRSGKLQRKAGVSPADDPLEHEADRAADAVLSGGTPRQTAPRGGGVPAIQRMLTEDEKLANALGLGRRDAPQPADKPEANGAEILDRLHGGRSLDEQTRGLMESRFGESFAEVRIHTGHHAGEAAAGLDSRAFTIGEDIVFGEGEFAPETTEGRRLLAHELAHVVQQRNLPAAGNLLQRAPAPSPPSLRAGDDIAVVVNAPTPQPRYSRTYRLGAQGAIILDEGPNAVSIFLSGLSPQDAAQQIADRLVAAELFLRPNVCVSAPGMTAPACADAKIAAPRDTAADAAAERFLSYIRTTKEPPDAVARYYQWVIDHRGSPEFTRISPPDLWAQSLRPPERPKDPKAEQTEHWLRFMKDRQVEDAKLPPKERALAVETMRKFQDWFDRHHGDPDFAKVDPAKIYADIYVATLKGSVETSSRQKLEAEKQAAASSPEALKVKAAKFDEFLAIAMKLWGYSSRTFPYSIPLDAEGKDILVTGDPALQRVLDALARDLVHWASVHMSDANYATVSVNRVLIEFLQTGYSEKIADAQSQPRAHETIDRNQILAKSALAAFGEAVGTGLFAIGVVGLFVGAEIITAGQATWLLVGMAGYSGVRSYVARRDEIERSGYSVPVADTLLHSAGDVVGVSQLVEGITGQRLGTNVPLGSEARSTQLGAGAGNITSVLIGSRAYRAGQSAGQTARLARPGLKPGGPNANVQVPAPPPRPAVPSPNPAMGSVEAGARAALPENLRPGLDLWSAEIRQNGGNPDTVFSRLQPERIRSQAQTFLDRYEASVAAADRAAYQAARAADDPLHPRLRNVRRVSGQKVTLHYETRVPSQHQVDQAVEVSKRTGEEVHLFGDTASGIDYPGIDGTIGDPPRALSLKHAVPQAHPNLARKMAGDALESAKGAGYTHVEVRIDMPGSKIADIKAAWDAPPPLPTDPLPGPAFEGSVIARITVHGADGEWTLTPPLAGPARTGVSPVPPQPEPREKQ